MKAGPSVGAGGACADGTGAPGASHRTGSHITAHWCSLRELMGGKSHSTTRAALIDQHRTTERDRLCADHAGDLAIAGPYEALAAALRLMSP